MAHGGAPQRFGFEDLVKFRLTERPRVKILDPRLNHGVISSFLHDDLDCVFHRDRREGRFQNEGRHMCHSCKRGLRRRLVFS